MKVDNNELLLISLTKFYRNDLDNRIYKILPIIQKTSKISLRLIDWFVTNYCKKFNIILIDKFSNNTYFNVYTNYRSQLKAFKKIQFDPFRRRDRINFYFSNNEYVETTIGQLNFFRWFLEKNLLDYIFKNYLLIESDMLYTQKELNVFKATKDNYDNNKFLLKKKRLELSQSKIKNMTTFEGSTMLTF